jgi:hypothetical protein
MPAAFSRSSHAAVPLALAAAALAAGPSPSDLAVQSNRQQISHASRGASGVFDVIHCCFSP